MTASPVPVALITGFLGSGKTTLLRRLATQYTGRPIAWIVNEFGALDIDGEALRAEGMEIVSLPGGSIFCRCLATPFLRIMQSVAGRAAAGKLDGVIIEASGISRPSGMERMLSEFALDSRLSVASITCVVDPVRFTIARATLPCVVEQVECSDYVLVNKADTVDASVLTCVEAELRDLTPAPLHRCVQCEVELDILLRTERKPLHGTWSEEPDRAFPRCLAETEEVQDAERLCLELVAIGSTLHRCKGILRVRAGAFEWVTVDWTSGGLIVKPFVGRRPERCGLVLIAKQGMEGPAQNLARSIRQGRYRAE